MVIKARKRINLDILTKLNTSPSMLFIAHIIWVKLTIGLKSNYRDFLSEWVFIRNHLAAATDDSY